MAGDSVVAAPRRPLRVALLGFGTVGQSVARILTERVELGTRLQLTHIFNRHVERKRVDWVPSSVVWTEDIHDFFDTHPDVVVEVIGGVEPVFGCLTYALEQRIAVVTANKQLLAEAGPALLRLAARNRAQIRFEAAVAGGIPLIHGIQSGLAGDRLSRITGILNGTSNCILSGMPALNVSQNEMLTIAQSAGLAEKDPSADIDGHDAGAKLVVLAGVAFQKYLQLSEIPRHSIRPVSQVDFHYARSLKRTIRQLAVLEQVAPDQFYAFVGPALVPQSSVFGRTEEANNAIVTTGQYGGECSFIGRGAGGNPTAVAVVSDLLAIQRGDQIPDQEWQPASVVASRPRPFYIRFVVKNDLWITAKISSMLSERGISLKAIHQEEGYPENALPFVVTVEPCDEAVLRAAVEVMSVAGFHVAPPLVLPIFDC